MLEKSHAFFLFIATSKTICTYYKCIKFVLCLLLLANYAYVDMISLLHTNYLCPNKGSQLFMAYYVNHLWLHLLLFLPNWCFMRHSRNMITTCKLRIRGTHSKHCQCPRLIPKNLSSWWWKCVLSSRKPLQVTLSRPLANWTKKLDYCEWGRSTGLTLSVAYKSRM